MSKSKPPLFVAIVQVDRRSFRPRRHKSLPPSGPILKREPVKSRRLGAALVQAWNTLALNGGAPRVDGHPRAASWAVLIDGLTTHDVAGQFVCQRIG